MQLLRLGKQLILPGDLQEKFGMHDGDYIEVEVVAEGILLRPVIESDAEKTRAWEQIFEAIDEVEDRQPDPSQTPEEQEADVFQMVKEFKNHRE